MNITLAQLRALDAVVESGSFTDAAVRLAMSQSAVSHAVAGLERALDGAVLSRGSELAPTALGRRILPHARAALASLSALESAARPADQPNGEVRLGAVPSVCQGLLPGLLESWRERLPGVRVKLYEGDDDELPTWLESGVVDAAILVAPDPARGGKVIARDEYCAVIRRDHPLAGLDRIPLAELVVDGIMVSAGGCERHVAAMYADAGIAWSCAHRVREVGTLLLMVEQGHGVAIVPALGRAMIPDLLVMKPLEPGQPRALVLGGPASRAWHPLAGALVEATPECPSD